MISLALRHAAMRYAMPPTLRRRQADDALMPPRCHFHAIYAFSGCCFSLYFAADYSSIFMLLFSCHFILL